MRPSPRFVAGTPSSSLTTSLLRAHRASSSASNSGHTSPARDLAHIAAHVTYLRSTTYKTDRENGPSLTLPMHFQRTRISNILVIPAMSPIDGSFIDGGRLRYCTTRICTCNNCSLELENASEHYARSEVGLRKNSPIAAV